MSNTSRGEPGWCLDRGVSRGVCKTRGVRFPALADFVGVEHLHVSRAWRLKSGPGASLPHPGVFRHVFWVGGARSPQGQTAGRGIARGSETKTV